MNLSKLVAQDVPLFLSLLADLFPALSAPPKGEYPEVEAALAAAVDKERIVYHQGWVAKVIQVLLLTATCTTVYDQPSILASYIILTLQHQS
jgi:Hydrolytic ATP binding site of dynein motor region